MSKAPLAGEQTGANPTDRGKKGTKRHVLTKAHGLPIELTVTGANVHDKTQVEAVLETMPLLPPFLKSFVDTLLNNTDLQLVSKLRKDARLKYLYQGSKSKKPGRPKSYDGDVNLEQLDEKYFSSCYQDEEVCIHQAVVWSLSLNKRSNLPM